MTWIGQALLLLFWMTSGVFGMHVKTPSGLWAAFLIAGLGCIRAKNVVIEISRAWRIGAAACGVACSLVLPFPYVIAAMVLAAGLALCLPRLVLSGVLLTAQAGAMALLPILSLRVHELPTAFALPVFVLMRFFGVPCAIGPSELVLSFGGENVPFTITLEKLMAPALAIFWTGISVWLVWNRAWRRLLTCSLLLFAFAYLRMTLVVLLYMAYPHIEIFTSWAIQAATFVSIIPMLLLLKIEPRRTIVGPSLRGALCGGLLGVSLVAALTLPDPGERKPGRIVIDEAHSTWELTDEPLDTKTYGLKTVYNYSCLYEALVREYSAVRRNRDPFSDESLQECDVLILKTPTKAYRPEELQAIFRFVERGGGVWLIGDHTNVFGMGTYLNQVATEFGLRFNFDSLARAPEGHRQYFVAPRVLRHPSVAALDAMLYATSDSLQADLSAETVLADDVLFSDRADYSVENFIGDMAYQPCESFGAFIQCAGARYGRGRVLAFTDSTLFSNFSMYLPGVHELATGSVEWLNRCNRWYRLRWLAAALALLAVAGCLVWRAPAWTALALGVSVCMGVLLQSQIALYPVPQASPTSIAFLYDHPGYRLPLLHETHPGDADSYLTFFVWTQRLGLVPRVAFNLKDAFRADAVVIIEPIRRFSSTEVEQLKEYVSRGGRLLVMDWPGNEKSTAADILRPFDLALGSSVHGNFVPKTPLELLDKITIDRARCVVGGQAQLTAGSASVLSLARFGSGTVLAFGAARTFALPAMGDTDALPNEQEFRRYQLEFWILRDLMKLSSQPER